MVIRHLSLGSQNEVQATGEVSKYHQMLALVTGGAWCCYSPVIAESIATVANLI